MRQLLVFLITQTGQSEGSSRQQLRLSSFNRGGVEGGCHLGWVNQTVEVDYHLADLHLIAEVVVDDIFLIEQDILIDRGHSLSPIVNPSTLPRSGFCNRWFGHGGRFYLGRGRGLNDGGILAGFGR